MMRFEQNPFAPPSSRPESDRERLIDFKGEIADFEHAALYGKRELPSTMEKRADQIRKQYPEYDHEPLDFYMGAGWQEVSNAYRNAFLAYLESAAEKGNLSLVQLTSDDVLSQYMTFPDRGKLESLEDRALQSYEAACSGHWRTPRAERFDAQVLRLDLQDRIVTRRLDGEERDEKRQELMGALRNMINDFPPSGERSELELMYLLRLWMFEKGLGHVLAVERGLPREDLSDQKIDMRLLLGEWQVPLQIKTEDMSDDYRREHYERVREKSAAATAGTGTTLIAFDTESLRDAYRLSVRAESKGERAAATRLKKQILHAIIGKLPEEPAAVLRFLLDENEEKKREPAERITQDFLNRNSNLAQLVNLGFLERGETNPSAIKKAKDTLLQNAPAVARIFKTRERYLASLPEDLEKLKTTLGGRG